MSSFGLWAWLKIACPTPMKNAQSSERVKERAKRELRESQEREDQSECSQMEQAGIAL